MPPPDTRRVIGSKIHALAKHVTSDQECRRLFGSNWSTKLVKGEVVSRRDARKPGGARANWSIVGNYIVQNVEKTKELNIRSVKKGRVNPSNPIQTPVIVVAEPVAQPIAAEENTREESAIENGTSIITRSPKNLPLLTLSPSFHSI